MRPVPGPGQRRRAGAGADDGRDRFEPMAQDDLLRRLLFDDAPAGPATAEVEAEAEVLRPARVLRELDRRT